MRAPKLAENNFGYLLAGLLIMFFLTPSLRMFFGAELSVSVMREMLMAGFSLLPLIGVWSLQGQRRVFRAGLALAALQLTCGVAGWLYHSRFLLLCAGLLVILFALLSCYIAARHVFGWRRVDTNTLIGAICIYLLLGLIWATLYALSAFFWTEGTFVGLSYREDAFQFDSFLYFSFVTLTTAGYGDITPVNPLIRTLAYLEMIVGQFYMAVLVAGLVGLFMGQRTKP